MGRFKEALLEAYYVYGEVRADASLTPEEVKEYCKKLIDIVGKGGGFIMDAAANFDDAKVENVKAMIDFTKEYGVYR